MAQKASNRIKYYHNANGPTIGTVTRDVIEKDGLYFKDIDGSGELKPYDDWRLPAGERAEALVKNLTVKEKLGQIFVSDWRMGLYQEDKSKLDESGILDEGVMEGKNIFGQQSLPGTSVALKDWFARHMILRTNPGPEELTDWINQLQAVAEECEHFVPVQVLSNSRNENGEMVFGMNDAVGVFAPWPGTLGVAAAVKGDGMHIVQEMGDCIRREWDATGMKKGYMYMADTLTDPRWQRSYGTFGEDPQLICDIFDTLIPTVQGSKDGLSADGVAMTVKHFPGGGARENGFDPHYVAGQWNVYATEGSLQKYHLPAFKVAVENNVSSIMPYYAKPAGHKSALQTDMNGQPLEMLPLGFAYNRPLIQGVLRDQLGFKGYINSDTGIVHNMCWGVETLDKPERIAYALNNGGVDLISGLFDVEYGMEALERAKNGYYDEHPVPEGFTRDELVLTEATLDRAVSRTLRELFELGMFENPYRDPKHAAEVFENAQDWDNAKDAHRKSVVLLKNAGGMLPLTEEKLAGKCVYVECFNKNPERGRHRTEKLRESLAGTLALTEDPAKADYAILFLNPSSGEYFSATKGYLELDICEGKTVHDVDDQCRPLALTHEETTLSGLDRIRAVSEAVRKNGGQVFVNVNVTMAWQLGNVEPLTDALTVGFDTFEDATLDVVFGRFSPVGKLPLTFPRGDEVLKVNDRGVCVSPNDVPGYDKDKYIPDSMKDENGKAYAYRDAKGNYYEMNFGLSY